MPPVGQFREHTLGQTVERAGDEQDVHIAACSPVRGEWGRTTAAFRAPPPGRFLRPDRIPRVQHSAIPSGRLEVAPQLRRLLDDMHDMHDVPATVLHRRMRILTWNCAAAALLTAFGALPPHERNCIRLIFLHEDFLNLSSTGRRPHASASPYCAGRRGTLDHPIPRDSPSTSGKLSVDTSRDRFMAPLPRHGTEPRAALRFLLQWSSPAGTGPHGARRAAARAASDGSLCFASCPGAVGRFRRW
ncbi:hypothetical protein ABTZ90_32380 [Streptomyces cellulosae]